MNIFDNIAYNSGCFCLNCLGFVQVVFKVPGIDYPLGQA